MRGHPFLPRDISTNWQATFRKLGQPTSQRALATGRWLYLSYVDKVKLRHSLCSHLQFTTSSEDHGTQASSRLCLKPLMGTFHHLYVNFLLFMKNKPDNIYILRTAVIVHLIDSNMVNVINASSLSHFCHTEPCKSITQESAICIDKLELRKTGWRLDESHTWWVRKRKHSE